MIEGTTTEHHPHAYRAGGEVEPEADAPRKRIKELEVMVAEVVVETPDTTTLVLFTGNDRLRYESGHFLTIDPHQFEALERFTAYFEELKGRREPARAYSLTSAPHERYLAITVKEERYQRGVTKYPPLLSPMLVKRTGRGMRLQVVGFTGPYVLPRGVEDVTDHLVHLVAGSGSVPNFSILKHALREHPRLRHTFVYSSKTWGDVIFREPLRELQERYPDRLRVVHTDPPRPHRPRAPARAHPRSDRLPGLRLRPRHRSLGEARRPRARRGAAAAVPGGGGRRAARGRRAGQPDQARVLRLG